MSAACWHCQNTDKCDCPFCGQFVAGCVWKPGRCATCAGRRNFDAIRARLDAEGIDPRERRYWTRDMDYHMLFDPFFEYGRDSCPAAGDSSTRLKDASRGQRGFEADDFFAMAAPDPIPKKRGKRK